MKIDKRTIVELRFPTNEEVLQSAAMTLQRNSHNEPYYSFVFLSDKADVKSVVADARKFLTGLFGASVDVIVTFSETKTETGAESTKIEQKTEILKLNSDK